MQHQLLLPLPILPIPTAAAQLRVEPDETLASLGLSQLNTATLGGPRSVMPSVKLSIEAQLCGPVSVGTVDVIKAVRLHAGLTLREAKAIVDRCVFEGETVMIEGLSGPAANALVAALRVLPDAPPLNVRVEGT